MSKKIKGSKLRKVLSDDKSTSIKKIKNSRIRMKSDKELEKEAIEEENMSIMAIVIIVILCFIIGILLGWVLYKIAINSSSSAFIVNNLLFR